MNDMQLITQFLDSVKDPSRSGRSGAGNQILFQGTVVAWDEIAKRLTVTISGTDIPELRYLKDSTFTVGHSVWGVKDGSVRIVLGELA